MIPAELALTKSFLDAAVAADSFEQPDLSRDVARLMADVDAEEAAAIGPALGKAIIAVSSDLYRQRSLIDVAARFDLIDALPSAMSSISDLTDPLQVATLATLASNPGVPRSMLQRFRAQVADGIFEPRLRSIIRLRLGLQTPQTELEEILDRQVWPGRHSADALKGTSPLVYIGEEGAPQQDLAKVSAAVVSAGGRVRRVRVAADSRPTNTWWAAAHYPLVSWSGVAVSSWKALTGGAAPKLVAPPTDPNQPILMTRFLHQIEQAQPVGVRFRPAPESLETASNPLSADLLGDGAFDWLDMTFLGGASRSTLQRLTKESVVLAPGEGRGLWRFDQLLTVRLVQAFKAQNKRFKAPSELINRLRDITVANRESEVAIDAAGNLYVSSDGEWTTMTGNQPALAEVVSVDEAFRTFRLGNGVVPNLLLPSQYTTVHPGVLAGTPTVRDRRVSARALAQFAGRGKNALRSAYPELQPYEIADGTRIGNLILARKGG